MVTGQRGPRERLELLPIDQRRSRSPIERLRAVQLPVAALRGFLARLLKFAGTIVLLVAVVLAVRWVIQGADQGSGSGSRSGGTSSSGNGDFAPDVAPIGEGTGTIPPATTPPVAPAVATEDAVALEEPIAFEPAPEITITPGTGLLDGQSVELAADVPTDGTLGLGAEVCARESHSACTGVTPITIHFDSDDVRASFDVPRRFLTWSGDLHDCVTMAPCELRVWGLTSFQGEPAVTPLEFDPDSAPRAALEVGLTPTGPFDLEAEVSIVTDDLTDYDLLQCAVDLELGCEFLTVLQEVSNGERQEVATVHRVIATSAGIHDCVLDGPCELRVVTWTNEYVEPVPLEFDPSVDPPAGPNVVVRPVTNLSDGTIIEIGVNGAEEIQPAAMLCKVRSALCLFLGGVVTPGGAGAAHFSVPRHFAVHSVQGPVSVDCGIEDCEVRVQDGRRVGVVPVSFDPTAPTGPEPQLALEEEGPFVRGSTVTLHGRGFHIVDPDRPPWVEINLCNTPSTDFNERRCANIRTNGAPLYDDGTFAIAIPLPGIDSFQPTWQIEDICDPTCWFIAATFVEGYGETPIAIEIEVESPPGEE